MGSSMEMLMDDNRRAAIEIIIEERTGERDPEDRDGNLPDLDPTTPANQSSRRL
jgi:hypothetical protein